nr:MAG TPA: hypothetical protein [Caudoviricetes sp.]
MYLLHPNLKHRFRNRSHLSSKIRIYFEMQLENSMTIPLDLNRLIPTVERN